MRAPIELDAGLAKMRAIVLVEDALSIRQLSEVPSGGCPSGTSASMRLRSTGTRGSRDDATGRAALLRGPLRSCLGQLASDLGGPDRDARNVAVMAAASERRGLCPHPSRAGALPRGVVG
jgi:hypothetical protein